MDSCKFYVVANFQAKAELCQCVPQPSGKTAERPKFPFKIITVWWICAILWSVLMSNKALITNLYSQGATCGWHILQISNEWQMTQDILLYLPWSTGAQLCPKCCNVSLWPVWKLFDHITYMKPEWNLNCSKLIGIFLALNNSLHHS